MKPNITITSTPTSPNIYYKHLVEITFDRWLYDYFNDKELTEHGKQQIINYMLTMLDCNPIIHTWVTLLARRTV